MTAATLTSAPTAPRRRDFTRVRHQLLGLVFLLVMALFLTVTVAVYRQAFTPVVHVSLNTDHVGNQMQAGADVKARGVVVGEVRAIRSAGDHAVLDLALDPAKVSRIPADVTARLLPKTLFGERYVALQLPRQRPSTPIAAGAVIDEDRSKEAVEIGKVLDDVMPVLQAVQPQKLSATLGAISTALDGRGKQLGDTLVQLGAYLRQIQPAMPDLDADIADLSKVADSYNQAAPQLLQALSDLTTTSRTFVDQQDNLRALYSSLTTTSVDLTKFLQVNQSNLINLTAVSRPTLGVLARYAPEYPCLFQQFAQQVDKSNKVYGKGTDHPDMVHLTLVLTASRGKYLPGVDNPRYTDDRGPRCYQPDPYPGKFPQYPPGGPIQDGSTHPPVSGSGNTASSNTASSGQGLLSALNGASNAPLSTSPQSSAGGTVPQVANSPAERQLVNALIAPSMGEMPSEVPSWASVLVGPLFRGAEVTAQ